MNDRLQLLFSLVESDIFKTGRNSLYLESSRYTKCYYDTGNNNTLGEGLREKECFSGKETKVNTI